VVRLTLRALYQRLGRSQSWSGRGGEEKNSEPLPGLEPLIIQPETQRYTTELSRLPYFNNMGHNFNEKATANGTIIYQVAFNNRLILGYSTMLFQLHKFGYTAPKQVER
jgi:hypothetical protein